MRYSETSPYRVVLVPDDGMITTVFTLAVGRGVLRYFVGSNPSNNSGVYFALWDGTATPQLLPGDDPNITGTQMFGNVLSTAPDLAQIGPVDLEFSVGLVLVSQRPPGGDPVTALAAIRQGW